MKPANRNLNGVNWMDKNKKARLFYLLLVLGYSYVLGILELVFKNGVCYDFLSKSFTFVPVLSGIIVHKIIGDNNGGHFSLKVWKKPKALIVSALLPGILIALGAVLYFLVFPNQYSGVFELGNIIADTKAVNISNPSAFIIICIIISAICIPIHLLELGEEIGWRGYLLWNQVDRYGKPKAVIINGIEWGAAHLPLIFLGFNYSTDNPGAPWTNMLMMMLVCVALGTIFSYVTLRTGNCMFAAIMHGVTNIIGEIPVFCSVSQKSGLLGPNPTGLLSMVFMIIAAVILYIEMIKKTKKNS